MEDWRPRSPDTPPWAWDTALRDAASYTSIPHSLFSLSILNLGLPCPSLSSELHLPLSLRKKILDQWHTSDTICNKRVCSFYPSLSWAAFFWHPWGGTSLYPTARSLTFAINCNNLQDMVNKILKFNKNVKNIITCKNLNSNPLLTLCTKVHKMYLYQNWTYKLN